MKFKDNPLKFLRKLKRMKGYNTMTWMYEYINKLDSFPSRIEKLQWALNRYHSYEDLCVKYNRLRNLYKKYWGVLF